MITEGVSGHDQMTTVAALIADPTRADILLALMDGRAFPASELAAIAHVSPSTASHHLASLVQGGLVEVFVSGRHRYHRLAGPQVAELLESLGSIVVPPVRRLAPAAAGLAECRTCYDHLAGKLGVRLRKSLEVRGFILNEGDRFMPTPSGEQFLCEFGLDVSALTRGRRPQSKACLDWTERVPHIGGALGAVLFDRLVERGWLAKGDAPRSIVVTEIGKECLDRTFPLDAVSTVA